MLAIVSLLQDTRGDPRPDPAGANSNDPARIGGRSLSRDRVNPNIPLTGGGGGVGGVGVGGVKNIAGTTTGDEPPPAISSADLDQLMADFDLDDPLMNDGAASAAPAAAGIAAAPAATTAANGKAAGDKPSGLAGALPGGLGAGLSAIPNPIGDANIIGKLGDLATQNPVVDVMSKGKSMLFKRFGL